MAIKNYQPFVKDEVKTEVEKRLDVLLPTHKKVGRPKKYTDLTPTQIYLFPEDIAHLKECEGKGMDNRLKLNQSQVVRAGLILLANTDNDQFKEVIEKVIKN